MTNMKIAYCNNSKAKIFNDNFEILTQQVKSLNTNLKQINHTIKCIKKNNWKRGLYNAKRTYY